MSLVAYASSDESDEDSESNGSPLKQELKQNFTSSNGKASAIISDNLTTQAVTSNSDEERFEISDDDDHEVGHTGGEGKEMGQRKEGKGSLFAFLPKPHRQETAVEVPEEEDEFLKKNTLKSDTDKSRRRNNSVDVIKSPGGADNDGIIAHDIESSTQKMNSMSKVLLSLPEPKNAKNIKDKVKGKGVVKIGLPALMEIDSDSDEEDAKQSKRTINPGKLGSGLMGLLPKPRHGLSFGGFTKSVSIDKEPKRKLLPYTLKKTFTESKSHKPEKETASVKIQSDEDDSDESESSNFFSLGSKTSQVDISNSMSIPFQSVEHSKVSIMRTNLPTTGSTTTFSTAQNVKKCQSAIEDNSIRESGSHLIMDNNKPKHTVVHSSQMMQEKPLIKAFTDSKVDFAMEKNRKTIEGSKKNNAANIRKSEQKSFKGSYESPVTSPYTSLVTGPYDDSVIGPYGGKSTDTFDDSVTGPYHDSSTGVYDHNSIINTGASKQYGGNLDGSHFYHGGAYGNINHQEMELDQQALLRLQGKRKVSKDKLNIVDVRGDQLEGNTNELLKQLTEEREHQPKKSKADMPKSQERRKHQITYLAFQNNDAQLKQIIEEIFPDTWRNKCDIPSFELV